MYVPLYQGKHDAGILIIARQASVTINPENVKNGLPI